ncbi:hypothetical protein RN001_004585 [Aquatica leii]|uniref:Cuticle protein n=1 Tax=Aquatica leii TaxID=1421715 RepID=A0AAN7SA62_9COLE|nr:hypothetical protein RN001_004585 [Aquatica leii]
MKTKIIFLVTLVVIAAGQDFDYDEDSRPRPAPTRIRPGFSGAAPQNKPSAPVAILKQINRHNEDGSYTYGYESADGSFKIETKLPTGEVKGKYGFVDDVGKLRVVEYGATKYGFEPQGEGITVAPPTLVDETTLKDGSLNPEYADNYYQQEPAPRPAPRPKPRPQPAFDSYSAPLQFAPAPQRNAAPSPPRPSQNFGGASLTTDIEFGPPQPRQGATPARSFAPQPTKHGFRPSSQSFSFEPAPIEEQETYAEPAPASRPVPVQSFRPAPASRPAPQAPYRPAPPAPQFSPAPRPGPVTRQSGGGGGILDQLAKDYAIQNGAPALHDISFGYY